MAMGLSASSLQCGDAHHYPHDPDDFARCENLLRFASDRDRLLTRVAERSMQWARLKPMWNEIHEAIEAEVPGYLTGSRGRATRGYMLMRRVLADGLECRTCNGTGRGVDCPKCKGTGRRCGGQCRASECFRGAALCATCVGRGYTGGDH